MILLRSKHGGWCVRPTWQLIAVREGTHESALMLAKDVHVTAFLVNVLIDRALRKFNAVDDVKSNLTAVLICVSSVYD